MPKLIYLGVIRIPTEKAHGLQIMQNCEALAQAGYDVELWKARRFNTAQMRRISDPFAHYGVTKSFVIKRLPILDLMPLARGNLKIERGFFYVQVISYIVVMLLRMLFTQADVYYSRDENILLPLSYTKPRVKLAYEPHTVRPSKMGRRIQQAVATRCGAILPLTGKLRDDLVAGGASADKMRVVHDGVRAERFANLPTQQAARTQIGWPQDAYIVGYMGQLKTMNMDKGVGMVVDALAEVPDAYIAIVGGPDPAAQALRQRWLAHGLPESRFLYAGQVSPEDVPLYLRAFDVGVLPLPWTPHFAFYTSSLKLFEYMAAGCAIVASALPATQEVVTDGETALLFPYDDAHALRDALQRLNHDTPLRQRLARNAYSLVMADYTWAARARVIKQHIEQCQRLAQQNDRAVQAD